MKDLLIKMELQRKDYLDFLNNYRKEKLDSSFLVTCIQWKAAKLLRSNVSCTTIHIQIHKNGSKIVFQTCHAGLRVPESLERKEPSTFPSLYNGLSKSEIEDIIESFRKSAVQAQKAGADGVQLHGAHGYLFSSFMSPFYNHRDDSYSVTDEGRCRFILETAEAIRKSCGKDFSVMIKINGNDFLPSGVTPELASKYVNLLKSKIDLFEISCGCNEIATVRPDNSKRKLFQYIYLYLKVSKLISFDRYFHK